MVPEAISQMLFQGLLAQVRDFEPDVLRRWEARFGVLPHPGKEHFRSIEPGYHRAEDTYGARPRYHDPLPGLYLRSNVHRVHSHGQRLAQGRHAKIELLRDRYEVLLEHHGVLGHPPVAGEADGHALGT